MATNPGTQRGFIQVTWAAVLSALGVFLIAGCSAGDSGEVVGEATQAAVICQCISNACVKYSSCLPPVGSTCASVATYAAPLTDCSDAAGAGVCTGDGTCCRTCYRPPRLKGDPYLCAGTIDGANCAVPGKQCVTCTGAQGTCEKNECDVNGSCTVSKLDKIACDDGNLCNGADSCQSGKCAPVGSFMCPVDSNPCHAPSCDPVKGCAQQNLSNVSCSDGDACNGAEVCQTGVCTKGAAPNCDDNNPCTVDSCDAQAGCVHNKLAPGSSCDDGDLCNGIGLCDMSGQCVVTPSKKCDDGDPCTDDSCDPSKGCVTAFNKAACNDGDPCTTVDQCNGQGACVGSAPLKCDDGNTCTIDTCVKGVGCQSAAGNDGAMCSDGNQCTTGEKCVAGKCQASAGVICPDDTNPCTVAVCDPMNGNACGQKNDDTARCQVDRCHQLTQCSNGVCPQSAPIDCDDANPCTRDSCDPASGCQHDPDDKATCNDGDLCTTGDACSGGKCVTKDTVCVPRGACFDAGTCNPRTGRCDGLPLDPGSACNNGTGTCDANAICVPNPLGEGGAGGQPGAGGDGTGGPAPEAGAPAVDTGGAGTEPTPAGGEPSSSTGGGSAGKGGRSSGGSASTEGGAPEVPEHVFVRDPGGCSCSVPASSNEDVSYGAWAVLVGAVAWGRRRQNARGRDRRPQRRAEV